MEALRQATFVKANSPYFAKLYQGVDENAPLSAYPAANKTELMAHFDDWLTDRSITKEKVDRFMVDLANVGRKIDGKYLVEITDRIVMHNEPCACGNQRPWLTLEGRTDDILTFENGVQISPLSLYAILKEVHGIERFQLIQQGNGRLELRLSAVNKQPVFLKAKQALENFLLKHGVEVEVVLSDRSPEANPISGKFKHIIAQRGSLSRVGVKKSSQAKSSTLQFTTNIPQEAAARPRLLCIPRKGRD